ncbi:MAG: glycine--tRNA ligase [Candidatus Nanopelagicales bacterium]
MPIDRVDAVVNLCKRRGFVFPSSEIYGGTRSAWDYGPLGVELKENIRRQWWQAVVRGRDDVVGIDSVGHPRPAGVGGVRAHERVRRSADRVQEVPQALARRPVDRGVRGEARTRLPNTAWPTSSARTAARAVSSLSRGTSTACCARWSDPCRTPAAEHFLRPETAQGIFVNYLNVMNAARKKPPFGIGQTGKSFRNEITPGNFIFRTREFEQMEMEFFVPPGSDEEWHEYWMKQRWDWYVDLGMNPDNLRFYEHPKEKLSHYSKRTVDIEYRFRFAGSEWAELEGVANRTDFDLTTHSEHSGTDLSYFDQETGERWMPYVIEPAAGLTRCVLAFLLDAYDEDEAPNTKGGVDKRTVLRFDPRLAPVKAAVLPLSRNEKLSPVARELASDLRTRWNVDFDDAGQIGRRYRRQDEIGTPFCITVDFDSLDDKAVTIRERDSMQQERIAIDEVQGWLSQRLPLC